MNLKKGVWGLRLLSTSLLVNALVLADEKQPPSQSDSEIQITPAGNPDEARSRAKMLHEMVRGTLQIMHRDFFDEENSHAIPSASLEDVFHEMGKSYDVQLKWLTVNTALAIGKPMAEKVEERRYQYAGAIRLGSQCLKCHVQRRTRTHHVGLRDHCCE